MKKFKVRVPELHYQYMFIEAKDVASARHRVAGGEGEYGRCEYSDTLEDGRFDVESWEVEEFEGENRG